LLDRREFFARSEDQLRNKLVTGGVNIHRERLQRKDSKREEGRKVAKNPAMTLRDAFEMRKIRERASTGADGETELEAAGSLAASVAAINLQQVPEEEPEEAEDDEAEPEPEPVDPVKVQAALEAAREKKRQQDVEGKRMRSKHLEKVQQPKYQEMLARRSTLPAFQMRDTILEAIDKHSVVVISGDTGKAAKHYFSKRFLAFKYFRRGGLELC
jgi:HrpA-like RNA helicase